MDQESFKIYKTTDEYKALPSNEKKKLCDKFRYMEQREEKLKYQKEYNETHKEEKSEKQKLLRAEKAKSKRRLKQRYDMKKRLLENPAHELGKRMFHLVITGEIDLDIFGKIDDNDLEYLKTFVLPDIPKAERKEENQKYYQEHREKMLDYAKSYREKKKEDVNMNIVDLFFRHNDPNRVLSPFEIEKQSCCPENISQREVFKFEKYKCLTGEEKELFLEKCEKQWKDYVKEVKDISATEKKQFLKSKNITYE